MKPSPKRSIQVMLVSLCLLAMLLIFFGEVLLEPNCYYPGDIARIYYPQRVLLARAVERGSLPWWAPQIGAGYPLLAEGETGALYPLNWLLYACLPVPQALVASIVLHYALSAVGLYLLARQRGQGEGPAVLGGLVWACGGFLASHLSHISILTVAAWLPWLLLLSAKVLHGRRRWLSALALSLVVALQFLGGHAQISLLGMILVGCYGLALAWMTRQPLHLDRLAMWFSAIVVGALIAAPQLLASVELGLISQRAGGLDDAFFTSYSFHPLLLATYLSPFALGNPYPEGSIELMVYVGLLPLMLGVYALWTLRSQQQRSRETWFWAATVGLGVLLSFGRWNPLYAYLLRVPILNLFRVPARYQVWSSLGVALLASQGMQSLLDQNHIGDDERHRWRWVAGAGVALVVGTGLILVLGTQEADELVGAWRWLPPGLALASALLLAASRRLGRRWLVALALTLLLSDLYAYGAVLDRTYNAVWPIAEIQAKPALVDLLADDAPVGRLYTKQEILPILSVQRASLYPNLAAQYDAQSVNIYLPLVPQTYESYLAALSAQRLNRLGVTHYAIPQLLPVDEASELYDVQNPLSELPSGVWIEVGQREAVSAIEVVSYLSHSAGMDDGEAAAIIHTRDPAGKTQAWPLRAGIETSEWAYERPDVLAQIKHGLAPVATTWPARSGYPPGDHPGHTYAARFEVGAANLQALRIEKLLPAAFVRMERIDLILASGQRVALADVVGQGDHSIVYRSEDVLVYRNHDAWPRAYTVADESSSRAHRVLHLSEALTLDDLGPAFVASYDAERVVISCAVEQPGYLVLSDLDYPGWHATVDGRDVAILAAEGVFRAVALPPGEHEIVFAYQPSLGGMLRSILRIVGD